MKSSRVGMALQHTERRVRRSAGLERRARGVTLVELVVVMAIVLVLSAIAVPMYAGYVAQMDIDLAVADIKKLEVQIERYRTDSGSLPDSLADLGTAIPLDPWGNPYRYLSFVDLPASAQGQVRKDKNLVPINSDYDLYSTGRDGATMGPLTAKVSLDDIVRGGNGGFVGSAEDF